jgi:hypothetical protein
MEIIGRAQARVKARAGCQRALDVLARLDKLIARCDDPRLQRKLEKESAKARGHLEMARDALDALEDTPEIKQFCRGQVKQASVGLGKKAKALLKKLAQLDWRHPNEWVLLKVLRAKSRDSAFSHQIRRLRERGLIETYPLQEPTDEPDASAVNRAARLQDLTRMAARSRGMDPTAVSQAVPELREAQRSYAKFARLTSLGRAVVALFRTR